MAVQQSAARQKSALFEEQITSSDTVVFTSFDGTAREVGPLPMPLGRATALASERTMSKIWGSEQEAKDCQDMFEER